MALHLLGIYFLDGLKSVPTKLKGRAYGSLLIITSGESSEGTINTVASNFNPVTQNAKHNRVS